MNHLCFAALCAGCCVLAAYLKHGHTNTNVVYEKKEPQVYKNSHTSEVKLNKLDEFRNNLKCTLSKAFFSQKDAQSAKLAVTTCIEELQTIIAKSDVPADYILGYRAIISFLNNLKDEAAYADYVKMIDTTTEINNISEAFAWLAAAMTESRAAGFSQESIKDSMKQRNVLEHVSLIVNKNIFPHLYKRQRDFLMPVINVCENTLISGGINNEPGPEDGPDIYANIMQMKFADAKEFDARVKGLREFAEAIADRLERDNVPLLHSNIEKLNEYMENAYMLKVELSDKLVIKPTQTMIYELVALCDNTIKKIQYELNKRKQNQVE